MIGPSCTASNPFSRYKQCKACPWKKSTNPHEDIPGGYSEKLHESLIACQSQDLYQPSRIMACHESPVGNEQACVGWLDNQLGVGNNFSLRLRVMGKIVKPLELAGEQYESVEKMVKSAKRKRRSNSK